MLISLNCSHSINSSKLSEIEKCYKMKKWDEVVNLANEIKAEIKEDPDKIEVQNLCDLILGKTYYEIGKLEQALAAFQMLCLRMNKPTVEIYEYLSKIYLKWEKTKVAIDHYLQAMKLDSTFKKAYFQIGLIHLSEKDTLEASKWFIKFVQSNPPNDSLLVLTHYYLGSVCFFDSNFVCAKDHFEKSIAINSRFLNLPQKLLIYRSLAEIYRYENNPDQELHYLSDLLELSPYDKSTIKYLIESAKARVKNRSLANEYFRIASEKLQNQKFSEAFSNFKKCQSLDPKFPGIEDYIVDTERRAKFYDSFKLANEYLAKDNASEAKIELEKALNYATNEDEENKAKTLYVLSIERDAIQRQADKFSSEGVNGLKSRKIDELEKALNNLIVAQKLDDRDPRKRQSLNMAYYKLGIEYVKKNEIEKAKINLNKVDKISNWNEYANNVLESIDKANEFFPVKDYLITDNNIYNIEQNIAQFYKNYSDSRALMLKHFYKVGHYYMSKVCIKCARSYYSLITTIDPDYRDTSKILEKLENILSDISETRSISSFLCAESKYDVAKKNWIDLHRKTLLKLQINDDNTNIYEIDLEIDLINSKNQKLFERIFGTSKRNKIDCNCPNF